MRLINVAAFCPLLFAAIPAVVQGQSERRSLSGDHVALYNVAGTVRVERARGRDVEVEITRAGRDAGKLRIESGTVRGLPTLRVLYPDDEIVYRGSRERSHRTETRIRDDGTWGGDRGWGSGRKVTIRSSGSGLEAWADIVVRVPDGRAVDAYLLVGELTARDVDANLRLDVASARVTAEGTRGALTVDAGSGGVALRDVNTTRLVVDNGSGGIQLTDVRGESCTIDTGSGGVTGANVSCERLSVDVGSGGVRMSSGSFRDVAIESGSGGVTLDLRRTPDNTTIDTGSGGVTLTLPASFEGALDIDTGSGGISSDFAVRTSRIERDRLQGTVGNGSARLRVDTGSGSVKLRRGS